MFPFVVSIATTSLTRTWIIRRGRGLAPAPRDAIDWCNATYSAGEWALGDYSISQETVDFVFASADHATMFKLRWC